MSRLFTKPRKQSKKKQPSEPSPPISSVARTATKKEPFQDIPGALSILRLSHDGRGVARNAQGKTVFVEGALAGEWVTARINKTLSRYDEAEVEQLLEASPDRQTPPCRHYGQCGGCQLQHLQPSQQLAFKQRLVAELLDYPEAAMATPLQASPLGYRRKARLGVKWRKDGRLLLGFRAKRSAWVTATPECQVLRPALQALLVALYELLPGLEGRKHLGHIELIEGESSRGVLVRLLRPLERMSTVDRKAWLAWAEAQGVLLFFQLEGEPFCLDTSVSSAPFDYSLEGLRLSFAANDFVQVNPEINQQMVAQTLDWLDLQGDERILDLFCGFGNFSLPLAQQAGQLLGVELLPTQVARAEQNAADNQLTGKARFIAADLNLPLAEQPFSQQPWDLVLLDPPRAGAAAICEQIQRLDAPRVMYISCNPVTLARDADTLRQQGYRLVRLGVMEMFPQTAHVETLALFVRDKNST